MQIIELGFKKIREMAWAKLAEDNLEISQSVVFWNVL